MSPSLHEQQQRLQRAVCDADDAAVAGLLHPGPGLAIYREAHAARLVAALRDNFLVLHRAMGDADFDALARAYLDAHPSAEPSIRWFGHQLAGFMAGAYADALPHPALVDVARMDWALRAAFDGPDAAPLAGATLQALAPEAWPALPLRLHPCAQLLPLAWVIEPAWRALRAHDPESGESAPELPAPRESPHLLLVWRQGLETRWRALDGEPLEAALLEAVAAGSSFGAICEQAAARVDEPAAAVVGLLQRWLADGLLLAPAPPQPQPPAS